MSLNVLRARKASTGWLRRRDRLTALLRRERPTILGSQEVLAHQASVLQDAPGASYLFVGHGRAADGGGEGCPVFQKRESGGEGKSVSERIALVGPRSL